jgi:serine protease Do
MRSGKRCRANAITTSTSLRRWSEVVANRDSDRRTTFEAAAFELLVKPLDGGGRNMVTPMIDRFLPTLVGLVLLVSMTGSVRAAEQVVRGDGPVLVLDVPSIVDMVDNAVVSVEASSPNERSRGSGIIIDKSGLIVTNFHVIAAEEHGFPDPAAPSGPPKLATSITVSLADGRTVLASVKGFDRATDVAVLAIPPGDQPLPVAKLGNSDALRVGEWVIAIGNPLGFDHTVTLGIVSGKGRVGFGGQYDDFLQTDAAINQGNSGGPLVNARGEVVGINTMIIDKGKGLSFAIPINIVQEILPQLVARGRVVRGYIGVDLLDTSAQLRQGLGIPPERTGILVGKVERGSPAARAGLRQRDFITALDKAPVLNKGQFNRVISAKSPGTTVEITFLRDGKEFSVKAEVAAEESVPLPATPTPAAAGGQNERRTP